MKKILFFAVALVAMSFASCGGSDQTVEAGVDSLAVDTTEVVADSLTTEEPVAADSVAVETVAETPEVAE